MKSNLKCKLYLIQGFEEAGGFFGKPLVLSVVDDL